MTKQKIKFCISAILILMFTLCGCTNPEEAAPAFSEQTKEHAINETISIIAAGDNLMHNTVIASGKQPDGTYDYSAIFEKVQPIFTDADIAVMGQETIFGGEEFGYTGYPLFNSPSDMGKTLVEQGFDVILHASNHAVDKGAEGIENTINFWKNYPDIHVLGINETPEDKTKVKIVNVKGADIAMLNYTYSTNGISLPEGKEHMVNYIERDKIMADALYAEKNADFTIAFMHWGTEYSAKPDDTQKALAEKMCQWGVDLIIGAHPHVLEPVEWIESENGNTMLVYYSLGNFVSHQISAKNLIGGLADVKLSYDGKKVEISEYSLLPVVTHYDNSYSSFIVYPLDEYPAELAAVHGLQRYESAPSVDGWTDIIVKTFEGYDLSIVDLKGEIAITDSE